jgi:fluoroacetyl-CoA thioesterase
VIHSAPTPLGAMVTAVSRFIGRDEKFYLFEVTTADPGGEIGRARHKRAIIDVSRLESAALRRGASVSQETS